MNQCHNVTIRQYCHPPFDRHGADTSAILVFELRDACFQHDQSIVCFMISSFQ